MEDKFIVAIDLGSSKIALIIAKVEEQNTEIIFYKEYPAEGISHGIVYNPLKVSNIIKSAIQEAENELKIDIHKLILSYSKYNIRQIEFPYESEWNNENFITAEEIENIKKCAISSNFKEIDDSEEIYEAIAQNFSTEDFLNQKEEDIIGMTPSKLKIDYKLFIGKKNHTKNIDRAINNIKLSIAKTYFSPKIIAKACLSKDDMDSGIALIDIGAGVSSVSIFKNGLLRYYDSIPFGGDVISNDIKLEAKISKKLSDEIKMAFGSCMSNNLGLLSEKILCFKDIHSNSFTQLSVKYLAEIIEARTKEIINALLYKIEESGFADRLDNGIALCGGGSNLLNITKLISDMSGYSVKRVFPRKGISCGGIISLDKASACTAISLIIAAKEDNLIFSYKHINKGDFDPKEDIIIIEEPKEADLFPLNEEEKKNVEEAKKSLEEKKRKEKNNKTQETNKAQSKNSIIKAFSNLSELFKPDDSQDI